MLHFIKFLFSEAFHTFKVVWLAVKSSIVPVLQTGKVYYTFLGGKIFGLAQPE